VLLNPDTAVHVALLHAAEALAPSLGVQVAAVSAVIALKLSVASLALLILRMEAWFYRIRSLFKIAT
jgi:hypothetical protein